MTHFQKSIIIYINNKYPILFSQTKTLKLEENVLY